MDHDFHAIRSSRSEVKKDKRFLAGWKRSEGSWAARFGVAVRSVSVCLLSLRDPSLYAAEPVAIAANRVESTLATF